MISGDSIKNKGKQAKGKNSVKKQRPNRKKIKQLKETENIVAGSRTRFICTCKQLLDHCTFTVTHIIKKNNFVISKSFFSAIDAV